MQLSLALQGGGAHGAFTWGVLDRLCEVPGLGIDAISATSSGAMNACALAQGWAKNGPEGAREELENFWVRLARWNAVPGWWAATARGLYEGAPLTAAEAGLPPFNPLRGLIEEFFDMPALQSGPIRLYLAATRVRDGRLRIFSRQQLSHDALLASACLPLLSPAVEILGEAFWDGGFAGNPSLKPLFCDPGSHDLLLVLLQPLDRDPPPVRGRDIIERAAQLSFGAALRCELDDFAETRRRLRRRLWLSADERRLKALRLHLITPQAELVRRAGNSEFDTRLRTLRALCDRGRTAAADWHARHELDLGRRPT